jgi:hypothetical protein
MGGRIHLDRGVEGGARFSIRLPGATPVPEQADSRLSDAAVTREVR